MGIAWASETMVDTSVMLLASWFIVTVNARSILTTCAGSLLR